MRMILAALGAVFCLSAASAHLADRPDLNAWAAKLHSKAGAPCCDGSDAEPIKDADWDIKDGHYRVHIRGEWVDVLEGAVVPGSNRYGGALVWGYFTGDINGKQTFVVRCFLPGGGV